MNIQCPGVGVLFTTHQATLSSLQTKYIADLDQPGTLYLGQVMRKAKYIRQLSVKECSTIECSISG
jgi:hypothetical protein